MNSGSTLLAIFRKWQDVSDTEAMFPGLLDMPLMEQIAEGYAADIAEQYGSPSVTGCYNRLTELLLILDAIHHQHFDIGKFRRSQQAFEAYRQDDEKARQLLRQAAELHQLPPDYYEQHAPDTSDPKWLRLGGPDMRWQRKEAGLQMVVFRPWLTDKEQQLIGKRGRAADDAGASRAAVIRLLDVSLPKQLAKRYSAIAALAERSGVPTSRQLVAATLKKGRT